MGPTGQGIKRAIFLYEAERIRSLSSFKVRGALCFAFVGDTSLTTFSGVVHLKNNIVGT